MHKVLIVDDHPVVRHGLRHILADAADIEVTAEADRAYQALDLISSCDYDAVLLDIALPDMNGIETLRNIRRLKPRLPVLILSIYQEEIYAVRAMKEGAAGYLAKDSASKELISAVRKICSGSLYITSSLAERLAVAVSLTGEKMPHVVLSLRELEVLRRIGQGAMLKSISEELHLSPKTISTYRTRILEKMRMQTNEDLIKYCAANRLAD